MQIRPHFNWKVVGLVAALLAAAACACPGTGTLSNLVAATPTVVPPTEAPDTPVPPTVTPADQGDTTGTTTDGGTTSGGSKNTGGTTTGGQSISPNAITIDNAANMDEIWSTNASQTALTASAASPIDHQLATFGFDKVVRLWDGDSQELLAELKPPHADYGFGLAYSPDGTKLASGGGFEVRVWDANTGTMLNATTVNASVYKVVWAPDSTALAVVGQGSSRIDVINPDTGVVEFEVPNPDGVVLWSVAFSPDGSLLATGNATGDVRVVNLDTTTDEMNDTTSAEGQVSDLEFSPDGRYLAACMSSQKGGIVIWNTADWTISLSGDSLHAGGCNDGAFSPDSSVYYSVGADGVLNAWDAATGDNLSYLSSNASEIWSVGVTGDGELVVLALGNGVVSVIGIPK